MVFSELTALLSGLEYQVYDTDVPEQPEFPYIVVWGGDSRPAIEAPLSDKILGVQDRVGVTCAAGTPEGARIVHRRVREVLQPHGFPMIVGGFTLKVTDHQPVEIDRQETITGTNRHPAYTVDIYSVSR